MRRICFKFDKYLRCEDQITQVCKSSFYHIRNISRIRRFLTDFAGESGVHSFITSKLDYATLFTMAFQDICSCGYNIKNSNLCSQAVNLTRKSEHITPILVRLHWLPVFYRIKFKIILLVFKCLRDMALLYLVDASKPRTPTSTVRSNSMCLLTRKDIVLCDIW